MAETITVRGEGITLDLLLYRRYGVRGRALLPATLAANPGLAARGAVIPLGTKVQLPELSTQTAAPVRLVTLFGA